MYIVLILTDTNTQFWKLAKKGESWFRKMFHPIFTTYITVYFKYNMSNKIGPSVISTDRRRSSNSRLSKVVIEAKRLKSHKKACEDLKVTKGMRTLEFGLHIFLGSDEILTTFEK